MNRKTLAIALVALIFALGGHLAGRAFDMDSVLQNHDPRADDNTSSSPAVQPSPTEGTPADPTVAPPPQGVIDLIDEITRVMEEIAKILEEKTSETASKDEDDKADKADKGSKGSDGRTYTVQSGDSLWAIAQRFLGAGNRYSEIVEANKGRYPSLAKNPNLIHPGWKLTIPGASGGRATPSDGGGQTAGGDQGSAPPAGPPGSMQQRVVAEAQKLVGRTNFPYAPATNGGRLGCAQVVSTALQSAGVLSRVSLGVSVVVSDLHARGWQDVSAPPFRAGDVICWRTYDRDGDGRDDPDTHIGIIMQSGNSVQAMSNSSSQRMPRLHSATYMPVTRVLRKA